MAVVAAVALGGLALLALPSPGATSPTVQSATDHPAVTRRAVGAPAPNGPQQTAADDEAFASAVFFLRDYERADGRVVRRDQGGDTVSEGEAYAMLLSVAAGDRPRFDAAWRWTRTHLLEPSGLLAWHWQNGNVTGTQPASDADVDAAYALELAATRFREPADRVAAATMAAAIDSQETAPVSEGRVLVAGPWAVGPPTWIDPSYASPAELEALGDGALGAGAQPLVAVAQGTRAVVSQVLGSHSLPPDWVQVDGSGNLVVASPSGSDAYGFDAVRLPIRWAASCNLADRRTTASLWPVLGAIARHGGSTVGLNVDQGARSSTGVRAPVGLVAAAAAAWAAGNRDAALRLLDRAEARNRTGPSYYGTAWVALGRVLLETRRLGTCGGP